MNCDIHPLDDLDDDDLSFIRYHLTKFGSDFYKKLTTADDLAGHIAVVRDQGEIVGWARTEPWRGGDGDEWNTLEAFVAEDYRHCGIASFAAAGIAAHLSPGGMSVAVFHPVMYIIATRAGLRPTLYVKGEAWVRA
jgi:hypothetical protein